MSHVLQETTPVRHWGALLLSDCGGIEASINTMRRSAVHSGDAKLPSRDNWQVLGARLTRVCLWYLFFLRALVMQKYGDARTDRIGNAGKQVTNLVIRCRWAMCVSCSATFSTVSSQVKVKLSLRRGALKHKAHRGALFPNINVFYHARVEILYSGGSLKIGN